MKNVSPRWMPMQFAVLLMISTAAAAQIAPADSRRCERNAGYRGMDFWIGNWDVETSEGKPAGKSQIELILGSCIILETWAGTGGYEGKSFNLFHPSTGRWEQIWVDNMGQITKYEGEAKDGDIYYRAESRDPDGTPALRKMTFYRKGPDQVRQFGESSKDGGKSWTVDYDLLYKRRK
ncbi:MAG: hypothetical protein ACRD21_08435 [Vicinamibacteria bacterium]